MQILSGYHSYDGSQKSFRSHIEDPNAGPEEFEQALSQNLDYMKASGKFNANVLAFLMPSSGSQDDSVKLFDTQFFDEQQSQPEMMAKVSTKQRQNAILDKKKSSEKFWLGQDAELQ